MLFRKFFITLGVAFLCFNIVHAEDTLDTLKKYKGSVTEIVSAQQTELGAIRQKLKVTLFSGETVDVENNPQSSSKNIIYKVEDKVVLQKFLIGDSSFTYVITDFDRLLFLEVLFIIFILLALFVGKRHGFNSIIGMAFSFFIIFKFILPQIVAGHNPIIITALSSIIVIPVTFYLSHGFNKKTHTAIISTVIIFVLTSVMAHLSVKLANLTGYVSDEAMFLQIAFSNIDMKSILLAGIIIGFLGVLDDVTVSQASIVDQLSKAKHYTNSMDLYFDAMNVGRDHITSMINTLVLVYAGASMPLLLLFINNPQPVPEVLNMEIVATEIIRTLVGSIGLILAVPLSTFIATLFSDQQ